MKKFSGVQFSCHYAFNTNCDFYCKPSMKGGHRHNHIYNKCHKHVFRSKLSRKNIDREDKKEFVRVFYLGLRLNHNFGEFLHKIFHKNNQSTAHKAKENK